MNISIEQLKKLNESQFIISKFSRKQTRVKMFIFIKKNWMPLIQIVFL